MNSKNTVKKTQTHTNTNTNTNTNTHTHIIEIHPHFRALFLAGERSDPPTVHWAQDLLKTPVIDNW